MILHTMHDGLRGCRRDKTIVGKGEQVLAIGCVFAKRSLVAVLHYFSALMRAGERFP